eukprot:Hpha_TRINITY_DN13622_c0_g1::TRINITY_DN13622_c0_g1_i3::g.122562::m.122562/K01099/INPP5B_F; inositol polyphosphate 5-phosphatase INPP5B/F
MSGEGGVIDASTLVTRVCTWNVAEIGPHRADPGALLEWLLGAGTASAVAHACGSSLRRALSPDLVVIGLQEIDMSAGAVLRGTRGTAKGERWTDVFSEVLRKTHRRVVHSQLAGLGLWLFASIEVEPELYGIDAVTMATGFFNRFGNKGGVCARVKVAGRSFCFVNSHLAAHQSRVEKRNKDQKRIQETQFRQAPQGISGHDYVFWFGDLNYRLDLPNRDKVVEHIESAQPSELLSGHDQLHREMREGKAFLGFTEATIDWGPTYKMLKGSCDVYNERRIPAYCDRVLFCVPAQYTTRQEAERAPLTAPCAGRLLERRACSVTPMEQEGVLPGMPRDEGDGGGAEEY